ncbi:MAG: cation diffusion facilitator family transporter [Actinomycetota bacterium]|jgi:cobalt-zinc-cadmium efflux system protein|nr:cation diffusion facilitator family transporter [Actinomycetota bacterium]
MTRPARLAVALTVNGALVGGQVAAGIVAHSTGLLADAGHNLTDVATITLSLLAVRWAARPRSSARSFGNHRGTILAALANAALLAVVTAAIVAESVDRLLHPVHVDGGVVVVTAAVAVVANGFAALAVYDHSTDLNMKSVLVHMMSDAAASLCVLAAGVAIVAAGSPAWDRADPIASLVIAAVIVVQAARLLQDSTAVLLESTPSDIDLTSLRGAMLDVPGVDDVHDLHVWSLSSEVRALSAHLVLTGHPSLETAQGVGVLVKSRIVEPFGITHTTLELECERCVGDEDPCEVAASVVTRENPE